MLKEVKYPSNYVVWDLETTGLDWSFCDILEIGVIVVKDGVAVEEKSWLLNSGKEVPELIVGITGITTELIQREGRNPAECYREALNYLKFTDKDCPNLTHNGVKFDIPFFAGCASRELGYNATQQQELLNNMFGSSIDSAVMMKAKKMGMHRNWNESFHQYAERVMRVIMKGVKYNVGICCDELEISRQGITQHRALADCYLTNEIYKKLIA